MSGVRIKVRIEKQALRRHSQISDNVILVFPALPTLLGVELTQRRLKLIADAMKFFLYEVELALIGYPSGGKSKFDKSRAS